MAAWSDINPVLTIALAYSTVMDTEYQLTFNIEQDQLHHMRDNQYCFSCRREDICMFLFLQENAIH